MSCEERLRTLGRSGLENWRLRGALTAPYRGEAARGGAHLPRGDQAAVWWFYCGRQLNATTTALTAPPQERRGRRKAKKQLTG